MPKTVDGYIEKQDEPKRIILEHARQLLLETIPDCKEEFKWGVPVYDGGLFYIAAMKSRVHVGFAITGLSEEEVGQLEGSGKTMRHIKIHSPDEFDEQKLKKLIQLVKDKATPPPDYR